MKAKKKKKKDKVSAYRRVRIEDCVPNDWNPNQMSDLVREKVQHGMRELLKQAGRLPPIVVRPHPADHDKFQIIDGFHRWDILRADGVETIDAFVLDGVTESMAKILTSTLNYLRGQADPEAYASYLSRILEEKEVNIAGLSEFLPDTHDEIEQLLDAYDIKIDQIDLDEEDAAGEGDRPPPAEVWMELKFLVPRDAAVVIEDEIARIASILTGKNARGRALEFMAVNSSQTPLESITGTRAPVLDDDEDDDHDTAPIKLKAKKKADVSSTKKKLKEKAR